jgi:hypothetical protein
MSTETDSLEERAESVSRQLNGKDAPKDTHSESLVGPTGGAAGKEPPEGVGENVGRRGEDMIKHHGKEAGRHDLGSDGTEADRPTGGSTARDHSGVDPTEGPDA